jgi:hypothetical protein
MLIAHTGLKAGVNQMQFRAHESAICRSAKIFSEIVYSRIDNTRLNFTLGIPRNSPG